MLDNDLIKQISNCKNHKIKRIQQKKLMWDDFDLELIWNNEAMKKRLSAADVNHINSQYINDSDTLWNKIKFEGFRLLDTKAIKRINKKAWNRLQIFQKSNFYYAFSTPFYSANGDLAIIRKISTVGCYVQTFALPYIKRTLLQKYGQSLLE